RGGRGSIPPAGGVRRALRGAKIVGNVVFRGRKEAGMRISLATLLLVLLGLPAFADDVYLTNRKSFKGVLADYTDSQVRIRMPGGEIRLPKASVAKVETGDSTFAEYLHRKAALGPAATAAEWLELARWSRANGFEQGMHEAALKAAELDPGQKGLAPLLRAAGYAFDPQLDRWIPYADEMRRQGVVLSGGQWLSREEQADRRRQREEQDARRAAQRAAEASRQASEAQRAVAEMQLYRETAAQGAGAGHGG